MRLTEFTQRASTPVGLLCIGVFLWLFTSIPPINASVKAQRVVFLTAVDTFTKKPERVLLTLKDVLTFSLATSTQVENVEKENRQLYASLAACTETQKLASQSATSANAALITKDMITQSILSYAGGQWIVLSGSSQGLEEGDLVLLDKVFLGKLIAVHSTYSSVETLQTSSLPFLVVHQKSNASGVLRLENNQLSVQFSKRVDDLSPKDLFLTVPDGEHAHSSYPVAQVEAITSGSTDSSSTVSVHPLANPSIGSQVDIILKAK